MKLLALNANDWAGRIADDSPPKALPPPLVELLRLTLFRGCQFAVAAAAGAADAALAALVAAADAAAPGKLVPRAPPALGAAPPNALSALRPLPESSGFGDAQAGAAAAVLHSCSTLFSSGTFFTVFYCFELFVKGF